MRSIFQNKIGQAMVEYAILIGWFALAFVGLVLPVCEALDEYVQGIYYVLQFPFP